MTEAEGKLFSQNRKRAGFRSALLFLFVIEAIAFVRFAGAVPPPIFAAVAGAAGLLLLPFVIGAFGKFRYGAAFYVVFLLAFMSLNAVPYFAAVQANVPFRTAVLRVQPGMKRQQAEAIMRGYESAAVPSLVELLHLDPNKETGLCALSFNTSTKFYAVSHGPFAHADCADVVYDFRGRVYDIYFVEGEYQKAFSLAPMLHPVRAFFWLFTQDCSYDSAND